MKFEVFAQWGECSPVKLETERKFVLTPLPVSITSLGNLLAEAVGTHHQSIVVK